MSRVNVFFKMFTRPQMEKRRNTPISVHMMCINPCFRFSESPAFIMKLNIAHAIMNTARAVSAGNIVLMIPETADTMPSIVEIS